MEENQKNQFIPASKWNDYHPWPPMGGLRHLIFWRKENGFEKVLKRPSRVWLIDEKAFFKTAVFLYFTCIFRHIYPPVTQTSL